MSEYREKGEQDECFGCPHKRDDSTKVAKLGKWIVKYRKDVLVAGILFTVVLGFGTVCGSCISSCQGVEQTRRSNDLLEKLESDRCKDVMFTPSDKGYTCPNKFQKIEKLDEKAYMCRCGE